MKFLNKMFGKGDVGEAALDAVIEQVFPAASAEAPLDDAPADAAALPDQVAISPLPTAPPVLAPNSEWLTLRLNLQSDPRATAHHDAVRRAIPLRDDRIDFYEELVSTSPSENYHSLSLARAYRAAGQNSDAVSHYQRYLRSAMDAEAFEELAEVYHAVGQAYLSSSSRQIAQSIRCKGVNECLSS